MVITERGAPPVSRLLMVTPSSFNSPSSAAASRASRARASGGWLETNMVPAALSNQRKAGMPLASP
jgi:hypothetical protein